MQDDKRNWLSRQVFPDLVTLDIPAYLLKWFFIGLASFTALVELGIPESKQVPLLVMAFVVMGLLAYVLDPYRES